MNKASTIDRSRPNAGCRCSGHDYYSRCIYHIVLKKAPDFEVFSHITGKVDSWEWPPTIVRHRAGEIIHQAISNVKKEYPFTTIQRRCIMPDHVHFSIFVRENRGIHLGRIIASLKRRCSQEWEMLGNPGGVRFFMDNYYDTFLKNEGQLKRMLDYISDNPRRWLVRRQHSGWFRRFVLTDGVNEYDAYGNWDLLSEPDLNAVKISRSYFKDELIKLKKSWMDTVRNDGVLVSPFISQDEKRVRDWAAENGGALIVLRSEGFGERYKPGGENFQLCSEGRLLEIVVPPATEAGQAYLERNGKPDYNTCQEMNKFASDLATYRLRLRALGGGWRREA